MRHSGFSAERCERGEGTRCRCKCRGLRHGARRALEQIPVGDAHHPTTREGPQLALFAERKSMNCERCQRPKFNPRSGSAPDCLREAYPDNTAVAATCNRLWAERVERERDEAIAVLVALRQLETLDDWSDEVLDKFDRTWAACDALIARFTVKP